MYDYSYTVENSNLYLNFPISFNSIHYIVEMLDTGGACTTYAAVRISSNKIKVNNIGFNNTNGDVEYLNCDKYKGQVLVLGF